MAIFWRYIIITCLMFAPSTLLAEYRAYQYYVKSAYNSVRDQKAYVVTSTLDPVSYQAYHGGKSVLKIDLLRTWICLGHTGNKRDVCLPPNQLNEKEISRDIANKIEKR